MSAAFRRNPGFISWDCHGCREEVRPSSGASGTTPSILRTKFPYNVNICPTSRLHNGNRSGFHHVYSDDGISRPTVSRLWTRLVKSRVHERMRH